MADTFEWPIEDVRRPKDCFEPFRLKLPLKTWNAADFCAFRLSSHPLLVLSCSWPVSSGFSG
jgi:hypothetical protein